MKIKGDITLYSLLRKLRSGFQMLSHIEWVSAYGSHISAASVLGIVGLVLAVRDGRMGNLKFISDKDDITEKLSFVPGLRNLGNNCFLNVVLQVKQLSWFVLRSFGFIFSNVFGLLRGLGNLWKVPASNLAFLVCLFFLTVSC